MHAILISAFNSVLRFLLGQATIKSVIFVVLTYLISEIISVANKLLPDSTNLVQLFNALPDSVWFFLNLAEVPYGLSLVFSSLLTRFIFGMLPVVGH
ncbi:DUF2523 domain-containing protein [Salmonella enterica]|uniref:DUF2523 domain-containing protein n=2 Tax=Salmonella TaxID=590 RepID=A0A734CD31_SALET|nr:MULTISPECIES: DUF2523 family protein [Salmonella]EAA7139067.1 DUF2523 domain-containing protein [Salmonella enterica]EBY0816296.1 DUF2523 domain-containing protein [Salmonella enterica subsp. enterica serovar Lattenkamp]ECF2431980.1 DUF2523 domain-containing protein [Salmonella enterica subsp. enterica serovar Beaudesert]EDR4401676.1 DUF2523 domain-containing protein [Salmonella enterica subsp. houtenae serovar 44:z4,z23:-]ASD97045.1 DUF2523 domain-containing protein [Salmonella enterica su